MTCKLCLAAAIATGWRFKVVQYQQFTLPMAGLATGLDVHHAVARLNARHANN
jgi:hypothetical protein